MHRSARGFTLIELMITVTVVAILAAIAIPSYNAYVIRSHRSAARACLMEAAQFMERHYTTAMTYVGAASPPAVACRTDVSERYTIALSGTPTATAYTVSATPTARQNDPTCGTLTLNQAGARTESGTGTVTDCW